MATRPASASPRRSLSPKRERGVLAPIRAHWFYLAAFSAGVLMNMAASAQPAASQEKSPERADRDPLGTAILERLSDPDWETVASKLPPLSKPREIVGVKDHPYEIGVAYDGTIQLPTDEDGWEQKGPTAWFEIGSPPVRLGTGGCKKLLADGYLPVVQTLWQHDGVEYLQTVFGWSEGLSPDKDLAAYVWLLAVAADSRLTVSLLTPASEQSCVKLPRRAGVQPIRCLITAEQPKLPGVGVDPQFGRRMPPLDRPGLRLLAVLPESVDSGEALVRPTPEKLLAGTG